jgi:hypothetical protein
LQQGGGRALIGGLPSVVRGGNQAAFDVSQFENQQRLAALGDVASAKEREMGREMDVYNQKLGMAQAALNAGVQTAASGIGQVGSAAMYGADAFGNGGDKTKLCLCSRLNRLHRQVSKVLRLNKPHSAQV